MTDPMTAPTGAIQAGEDNDVLWLQPRSAGEHASFNARSKERFRQFTVSLGLGALLTFGTAGAAVAPAAASTQEAETPPAAVVEAQLPEVSPVSAAPASVAPEPAAAPRAASAAFEVQPQPRDPRELIQFDGMRVPRWIVETILRAAEDTGVDPAYMMALADKESSFIPANKASTSSAEGLFQFISSTWLEVVKTFGAKHGLEAEADLIDTIKGELTIADEAARDRVLGLRRDPYLSALMAAEMMKRDRSKIERRLGREITRSEFYLAHFFGVDSASKFMSLVDGKPQQSAPKVFPAAARANKSLFFEKNGKKTRQLSVAEVYDKLDRMIDKRLDRYEDVAAMMTADASF